VELTKGPSPVSLTSVTSRQTQTTANAPQDGVNKLRLFRHRPTEFPGCWSAGSAGLNRANRDLAFTSPAEYSAWPGLGFAHGTSRILGRRSGWERASLRT